MKINRSVQNLLGVTNNEIPSVLQLRGSYRVVLEATQLQTSICNSEHFFVMVKSGSSQSSILFISDLVASIHSPSLW